MIKNKLKIVLPAGSLKDATLKFLNNSGYKISVTDRSYFPVVGDYDVECLLIRAQEIPKYIELGKFDIGITGKDCIEESGCEIKEIGELKYSKYSLNSTKMVIAVPASSKIKEIKDLNGKIISTEFIKITEDFLKKNNIKAKVEFSYGATEAKAPYLADAIVELVDSGKSLKANGLKIIKTIMESTPRIITNNDSYEDEWKRQKIKTFLALIKNKKNEK